MATSNASVVAKTFTHIIQELESAEDTTTSLGNSISHLRREIEYKRQLISNESKTNQKLADEVAEITEKSAQCVVNILELECERKRLLQQIEDAKHRVTSKRKELEHLKIKNNAIMQLVGSIENFASQRSLFTDPAVKVATSPIHSDNDNWEDLSGVDLSEFTSSQ